MVKLTSRRIFRYGEAQVFLQSTKSQSRNPLKTIPLIFLQMTALYLQNHTSVLLTLKFSEFSMRITVLNCFHNALLMIQANV